jgi:hypothetical protein
VSTSITSPTGSSVSGSISGSFVYNTETFGITSASLTITGINATYNQTYDQAVDGANSSLHAFSTAGFDSGDPVLLLRYQDIQSLVTLGNTVSLQPNFWSSLNSCVVCSADGPANSDIAYVFDGTATVTSVVPLPGAVLLFGSGLLGLIGIARRKKAA